MLVTLNHVLALSAAVVGVSGLGTPEQRWGSSHTDRAVRPNPIRNTIHERASGEKRFLNANTTKFALDGKKIPDVDFDIGEAYAGNLPISSDPNDPQSLYFWFQPSTNPKADKEIVIWLNGGPGCSSLEGFLQENGPFLWQWGTYKPVPNPWAWSQLTNMVWVDQPVTTGFSTGNATAKDEFDVAKQFLGFYKNLVDTFSLQGYKVYVTGESYAGLYCPYISSAMVDAKDETYYNIKGMMIYDPVIAGDDITGDMVAAPINDQHSNLLSLNETFVKYLHDKDKECGYADLRKKYLTFPPPGNFPSVKPGPGCNEIDANFYNAIVAVNPCFNPYEVSTTCPMLWDVLGFPGRLPYTPDGANVYFDRADVKKAINAPASKSWSECGGEPFVGDDEKRIPPSIIHVLPNVIDHTKNVIIGSGSLDYVVPTLNTILGIQNMTWGGKLGFQKKPVEPLFVPYHQDGALATLAGSGVMGTTHEERGLTFAVVGLSGHMVPQFAPTAAYRQLEKLLGRVCSLSSRKPFTTDSFNTTQPQGDLGHGTVVF